MTRINVIGKGFVDMSEGMGFKAENPWFRFAEVEMLRSVEFDVPMNESNKFLFGYTDDPAMDGEFSRRRHPCQVVCDSVAKDGFLVVDGRKGTAFTCVFYEDDGVAEKINERKLSDCPEAFLMPDGVVWGTGGTVRPADAVNFTDYCAVVDYNRNLPKSARKMNLVSVNVYQFLHSVLDGFDVLHDVSDVPTDLWAVCPTLERRNEWDAVFEQTDNVTVAVREDTQTPVFEVVDIRLMSATMKVWFWYEGVSRHNAKGFKATKSVTIEFPATTPTDFYVVKWLNRLDQCKVLGGGGDAEHPSYGVLAGKTVSLEAGDVIFFADTPVNNHNTGGYGWDEIKPNFGIRATASVEAKMERGDKWYLSKNLPDCTVVEWLQWVCLATGLEWRVENGVLVVSEGRVGVNVRNLDRVAEVSEVSRKVEAWGGDTREAVVRFDSDEYVLERISSNYTIDNDNIEEVKEYVSGFSEGGDDGSGNLFIQDFAYDQPHDLVVKKWTLGVAGRGKLMKRIEMPYYDGYGEIADCSTMVRLRAAMTEKEFFDTRAGDVFLWRGVPYVWVSMDFQDGFAYMTLQRVRGSSF